MTQDRATAESLGLLRLVVFGTWFVIVVQEPLHRLAHLPRSMFERQGVLALVPDRVWDVILQEGSLHLIRIALVLLTLAVAVSLVRIRSAAVACVTLLVLREGILFGLSGRTNHSEIALLLTAGILAFLPIHDGLTRRPADTATRAAHAQLYRLGFLLPAALLVATYFFVGLARIAGGRLTIYSDGSMQTWVVRYWLTGAAHLAPSLTLPEPPLLLRAVPTGLWGVLLAGGTLLELTIPLALVWRPMRLVGPAALVAFHLATAEVMGVNFYENVVLLTVLFSTVWFHVIAARLGRRWPLTVGRGMQRPGQDARVGGQG